MPGGLFSPEAILSGILAAVLGGLGLEGIKWWYARHRDSREPLTGEWIQTIDASGDQPRKQDKIRCRQHGEFVEGQIERLLPADQIHRRWHFKGTMAGGAIYCAYWPTNRTGKRGSYGTIQLTPTESDTWSGYYIKLLRERDGGVPQMLNPFATYKLTWNLTKRG